MLVFLFLKWLKRLRAVNESNGQSVIIENLGEKDGFVCIKKGEAVQGLVVRRRFALVRPKVASDPVLVPPAHGRASSREYTFSLRVFTDSAMFT